MPVSSGSSNGSRMQVTESLARRSHGARPEVSGLSLAGWHCGSLIIRACRMPWAACRSLANCPLGKPNLKLADKRKTYLQIQVQVLAKLRIAKPCETRSIRETWWLFRNKCKTAKEVFSKPCETRICETCEIWFAKTSWRRPGRTWIMMTAKHLLQKLQNLWKLSSNAKLWWYDPKSLNNTVTIARLLGVAIPC